MNEIIKVEELIERLNNFDFKKGTKIKFSDKVYLYDYPNLVGIYEIGKPTKREYSIFTQFDITNLHDNVEIIEEDEDINIQDIKELPETIHTGNGGADLKDGVKATINEIIRAVKYLEKTKEDK